jgi:hypothetical protein
MRLERLPGMGFHELASRGRQEVSKWLERLGVARDPDDHARGRHSAAGAIVSRHPGDELERALGRSLQRFNLEAPGRFFAGANEAGGRPLLDRSQPRTLSQLLAAAEPIGRKRFDLLGYRDLSFGDPIDWHLDPVSGRRTRFAH